MPYDDIYLITNFWYLFFFFLRTGNSTEPIIVIFKRAGKECGKLIFIFYFFKNPNLNRTGTYFYIRVFCRTDKVFFSIRTGTKTKSIK